MKKTQNIILIIIIILLIVVVVSGITFAAFTWQTSDSYNKIISGTSSCFKVNYVKGSDIGSNENSKTLLLGSSYLDGLSTTVKISLDTSCSISTGLGTIYLNTDSTTDDYFIEKELLHYEVLVDNTSVSQGLINTKESIPIYSDFSVTRTIKQITVYIWLNGALVNDTNWDIVSNLVYKGSITASVDSR